MRDFHETLAKAEEEAIDREEAFFLFLETEDREKASELYAAANHVRRKCLGDAFRWSGGVARVLRCNLKPNCLFCPYWREAGQDPLSKKEIVEAVRYIQSRGIREFHLSGGTTLGSAGMDVLNIVQTIRAAGLTDMEIDVNCGAAMSVATLKALKELGVVKIGAVFETVNPRLFKELKPGDDLDAKKAFAKAIGEAGLTMGTGILVGLDPPAEKYANYVDFIFHVKEYEHLASVYVSKFVPFPGIVLADRPPCPTGEALRVLAVARLVLRKVSISTAQGWTKGEGIDPVSAGAGNRALGVHITRDPKYKAEGQRKYCKVVDGVECCDYMEVLEERLKGMGISVLP